MVDLFRWWEGFITRTIVFDSYVLTRRRYALGRFTFSNLSRSTACKTPYLHYNRFLLGTGRVALCSSELRGTQNRE